MATKESTVRIEVNQLPPIECSPNWRGHWAKRYRAAKAYREVVYYLSVDARNRLEREPGAPVLPFPRARLDLAFIFPHWQGRDEDNLRASFKPGQDALVQAQLILDDSMEHLELGNIEVLIDRRRAPLTIIDLEEV